MDKELAKGALQFLQRATLQASEIQAYQIIKNALMVEAGLAQPAPVEVPALEEAEKISAKK